jgi:non-ribosomal peptide synthetase component F
MVNMNKTRGLYYFSYHKKIKMSSTFVLSGSQYSHPTDQLISDQLESFLSSQPAGWDRVAILQAGDAAEESPPLSFRQLNALANQIAHRLNESLCQSNAAPNSDGDLLIAVRFAPDPGLIVSLLAIMKAGMAYVPIAPDWPELRIRHILEEARPIAVLTNLSPDIFRRVQLSGNIADLPPLIQYADLLAASATFPTTNLAPQLVFNQSIDGGQRLLAVLYTSGSTGRPKGVRLLHGAALNRMSWYWRTFPYGEHEVCVFKTTLTFVDSIAEIWSPLLQGRQLVIFPRRITQNVADFVAALDNYRIGRVYLLTGLMRSILSYVNLKAKADPAYLASVRLWELTAEAVTKDVLLSFFDYFKDGQIASNFYGSTETMDVVLYQTFRQALVFIKIIN